MKKTALLFITIVCFHLENMAFTLSPEAKISILTCSPGSELYSLFGHTAIRVNDPSNDYDQVFNYGTFDFKTRHFYLKYAQGLLPYYLSKSSFDHFMEMYRMEERSVYSQTLLLDSVQKQTLFDLLLDNYLPQNRAYLYNFLFDNCTTRSRDIIARSLPGKVEWNLPDNGKNFWNLLDEYLQTSPWVQWGIHTILGQRGNRPATPFQYMFLPDYFMYGLNSARYDNKNLAANVSVLYQASEKPVTTPWYLAPVFIFAFCVFLIILSIYKSNSRSLLNTVSVPMFLFSGIVGCLIVFLGIFTEHPMTAPNWNILWANPLNLFVWPFLLRKNPIGKFAVYYLHLYLVLLATALPVWMFTQPAPPVATLSLVILLFYLCLQMEKRLLLKKSKLLEYPKITSKFATMRQWWHSSVGRAKD